jgi:hypothetical protein
MDAVSRTQPPDRPEQRPRDGSNGVGVVPDSDGVLERCPQMPGQPFVAHALGRIERADRSIQHVELEKGATLCRGSAADMGG